MGTSFAPLSPRRRRLRRLSRRAGAALAAALVLSLLVAADRLGLFGRPDAPDAEKYDEKTFLVTKVVDGDTIDLGVPDRGKPWTRVRLWGVDTPEMGKDGAPPQHFAVEATEFTRRQALDRTVRLELEPAVSARDKYGRLLAFVYLPDGRLLNRLLVEEGCAYADPRFRHHLQSEFRHAQTAAKNARRGLWKDLTEGDLPQYLEGRVKTP